MSRPKISASEAWSRWLGVLVATGGLCARIEETGGEEPDWSPSYRRAVHDLAATPFPVDGASPAAMARAFLIQAQALFDVALSDRRVAIAHGVAGSVRALEALWHAEQTRLTQVQLTRAGAGD